MPSGSESRGPDKNTGAKSAKAINAAKKNSGGVKSKRGAPTPRHIPWLTLGAGAAVAALVAVLAINLVPKYQAKEEAARFAPSADNLDPSDNIDGVVKMDYPAGLHVQAGQRVAYDQTPAFGGPHDAVWATCTGTVYPNAIRTENAVHSLEHGAVWVTYNPDTISSDQIETLEGKVDGESYMLMSPYPGQESPVALQSWGHQLNVDSADDERIGQFIAALRINKNTHPEVGASCSTIPGAGFDPDNPPAFDATAPGPDAVPMDGGGITPDQSEIGGLPSGLPSGLPPVAPQPPAAPPAAPQVPGDVPQAPVEGGNG